MSDEKVYAVFREGVYRHECGGIFSTLEKAKKAADELALGEPDDHHRYCVTVFQLDTMATRPARENDVWDHGDITEASEEVYEVKRSPVPVCKACKHDIHCHDLAKPGEACVAYKCSCQGYNPDRPREPTLVQP